ncbi:SRPBCC domain-containing protein [Actinoplanes sp. KI2]|uniref:SRPBCC family protein n=1 Tax=Actinoplanes sp. KI2 TaxID=2983315 RepID=UPI0021D5CBB3|nr:SRPBCC domain-containing protein [Actinoplanes sp. KI2]MCU7722568.1 SRPBCC domain-containing protein [Actinoplanes sp. KI2]
MGKEFEIRLDAGLDATPEQIWDAIATGPGISTWFIGRTEIDNGEVRTAFGDDWIPAGTITTNDKPHHFAYGSQPAPDGRFIAYDYLIEGHDRSGTVLRAVTSGFLPGDDWTDEYEAMQYGTQLFFATLVEYLRHFPGRPATPVTAFGPPVTDWPATWAALHKTLGLGPAPRPGDPLPGGGQVYFVNPHTLGLRTPTGLHRYLRGFHGALVAGHALTAPDDTDWTALLNRL